MAEIAYAPVEMLPVFETPQLNDVVEAGIFGQRLQEWGKRAGTAILAANVMLGLGACDPKSDLPDEVKGVVITHGKTEATLVTCVRDTTEKNAAWQYGKGDFKKYGMKSILQAAKDNDCTSKLGTGTDNCKNPDGAYLAGLVNGDIAIMQSYNHEVNRTDDPNKDGDKANDGKEWVRACSWIKEHVDKP